MEVTRLIEACTQARLTSLELPWQVQAALAGPGWSNVPEDALKALPGPHFERKQHDAGDDASTPAPAPATAGEPRCFMCASLRLPASTMQII